MKLKHLWKAAGLVALSAILILTLCLAGLLALVLRSAQITQFWNAPLNKALPVPGSGGGPLSLHRRGPFGTAGPLAHAGRTGRSGPVAVQQAGGGP